MQDRVPLVGPAGPLARSLRSAVQREGVGLTARRAGCGADARPDEETDQGGEGGAAQSADAEQFLA
eukprot:7174058-Alexandrium_andersonii.AAC.1